jgi:hypothetical protein
MKLLLLVLLLLTCALPAQKVTLNGTITEAATGEALMGVNVYLTELGLGTVTNAYGFYSLSVATVEGVTPVVFSYLGYRSDTIIWARRAGAREDLAMLEQGEDLGTVEVRANGGGYAGGPIGVERLSLSAVSEMPVLLGEKDIFKGLQMLPGVSNPREGSGGLYVRGGSPDQNLILLDGAPVYNAFHLFGFLSVFNADALSSVDLYKGSYPARYGGRVASVVDIRMKEGNREKWSGAGGIGLVSSRLTLEGPLGKSKKGSIIVSGRRTYFDLLLNLINPPDRKDQLYFFDGNAKVNYQLGDRDRVFLSAYTGRDNFGSVITEDGNDTRDAFDWGNRTFTARWNHQLGERAFLNVTAIGAGFDFSVENEELVRDTVFALEYFSGIKDLGLRADLDWYLSPRHSVRMGLEATRHDFTLSTVARTTAELQDQVAGEQVLADELAVYLEDEFAVTPDLTLNYGLRAATFRPDSGAAYGGLEPRLALSYRLNAATTLKAGYGFTRQFLHLLSNSGPGLPTSLWVPAGGRIPPQHGHQFSAGASYAPTTSRWAFNVEAYYRKIDGLIGYENGATFLLLDVLDGTGRADRFDILDKVTTGDGRAYGLELVANYRAPKLTANVAYTLARVDSRLENVNGFDYFPANQDRRHDLNLNGVWRFHPRLSLSFAWTYGSGVPTTIPRSQFTSPILPGNRNQRIELNQFTPRNAYRFPAVHRLDLGLRWRRSPKWGEAFWELGFYNAYNRANPFYLTTQDVRTGEGALFKSALLPVVPSVSYQFKF